MKRVIGRTPSASMIVAVMALIVAASGTAVAATKLVSGDSLIKKHSLSGNRLRNHTITGTQVNLGKLGKVPSAHKADQATSATSASTATNATNATEATNAGELGGQPASDYLTSASRIGTPGIVKASGTTTGNTVALFKSGPFTVNMTCTKTASGTTLTVFASSSEANSDLDDNLVAVAGTPQDLGANTDIPITAAGKFASKDNVNIDLEAPSGAQAMVLGADGVNSLGTDCWANWVGLH